MINIPFYTSSATWTQVTISGDIPFNNWPSSYIQMTSFGITAMQFVEFIDLPQDMEA